MATLPSNAEVARRLLEIRTLMEFAGEPFFKYMAYERAAEAIENASPIGDVIASGQLTELPGVGKTIAGRIEELCATGTCGYLEELRARYPRTLLELLEVPGLGIKTAQVLFEKLGIASLVDLEHAIALGTLNGIPRLGKKSIDNLTRGVLAAKGRNRRTPLGKAFPLAREIVAMLVARTDAANVTPAGSTRRGEATVGDIDIVCTSDHPREVIAAFTRWEHAGAVVAEGETKASVWMNDGLQIDLRVLPAEVYGNLLQHFTGSREHNIQLRELAVRSGFKVSENGIVDQSNGRLITCRTEAEVYATLGLAFIPPEMRVGLGEIEAARNGSLPQVVEASDLRGDLRVRVTHPDQLALVFDAARARGYAYVTIAAPQWGHGAHALEPAAVRALAKQHHLHAFCALECGIDDAGRIEASVAATEAVDFVIAAFQDDVAGTRAELTARAIAACEHPAVAMFGHPSGRIVEGREGLDLDYDALFAAAARTGTWLEINGDPRRLDLPGALVQRARASGARFVCTSAAQTPAELDHIAYALGQARRGWLTATQVLNTHTESMIAHAIAKKRAV